MSGEVILRSIFALLVLYCFALGVVTLGKQLIYGIGHIIGRLWP